MLSSIETIPCLLFIHKSEKMAVCNIFNELTQETGTFLTFSQYMEDLTREFAEGYNYHIVPSKFIAMDVDYSQHYKNPWGEFKNDTITKSLMHYFENGCAIFRNESNWTPNNSTILFWNAMKKCGFLSEDSKEIMYVGDINLQSYEEYDGMGYSEVYCYIPNEAIQYSYPYIYIENNGTVISRSAESTIEGYNVEEIGGRAILNQNIDYSIGGEYVFSWNENKEKLHPSPIDSKSFNINTIVLLYDVFDKDGNKIYTGVPMGIYFTGLINDGKMTNSITKFVSNEDIYNTGTSYGLRICSRFVSVPGDRLKINNVTVTDNGYSELSKVMTQMSISQTKMDELLDRVYTESQNYKDLIAIFKNSRTNVPYIKNVNGESVWFVNGRMLNSSAVLCDCDIQSYTDQEMIDFLNSGSAKIIVSSSASDIDGNTVFIKGDKPTIYVSWETTYLGQPLTPDSLKINGKEFAPETNSYISIMTSDQAGELTTKIEVTKQNQTAESTSTIKFVNPTYFGSLSSSTPTKDDIKALPQYAQESKSQEYQYYTETPSRICLAYPAEYGELVSIKDSFGHEYLNPDPSKTDFILDTARIDGIEYNIYIDRAASTHEKIMFVIR